MANRTRRKIFKRFAVACLHHASPISRVFNRADAKRFMRRHGEICIARLRATKEQR